MNKIKVGLVLGGGGARGLAHIGVIKGLLKHGIDIHCVVGASMGAIVGAAYAVYGDISKVESVFKDFFLGEKYKALKGGPVELGPSERKESFFHFIASTVKKRIVINLAANRKGLVSTNRLQKALQFLIPEAKIENLALPFACTALNLVNGQEEVFERGDLRTALLATASIPGYLPPVQVNGHEWVDGAVINSFPVELSKKLGASFSLVSDVADELEIASGFDNIIEIFIRTHRAVVRKLNEQLKSKADFVISPELGQKSWMEFEEIEYFIEQGEQAVEKQLEPLKQQLKKQSRWFYRWPRQLFKTRVE